MKDKKRTAGIVIAAILGCAALLYLGGMLGQLLTNYAAWMQADGLSGEAGMEPVSWNPLVCFPMALTGSGLKGMLGIVLIAGSVFAYVKLHDRFDGKSYDPRVFTKIKTGIYGTASWMEENEMRDVLEIAPVDKAEGTILGEYKGKDQIVRPLAIGAMGDAYMELDNAAEAAKCYERAANETANSFTGPMFLMRAGLAYEMVENYKKALDMYKTIKAEYPNSNEGFNIDKYIAYVEAKMAE